MSETIISKTCYKCKQVKSLEEFYKDRTKPDGLEARCKACAALYRKSPARKLTLARYGKTEKNKICQKRYNHTPKGAEAKRRCYESEHGKAYRNEYRKTEAYKKAKRIAQRRYNQNHRLENCTRICVNDKVERGKLPRPDTLICTCGNQAQEYHHPNGYDKAHRYDIIALCMPCHKFLHRKY